MSKGYIRFKMKLFLSVNGKFGLLKVEPISFDSKGARINGLLYVPDTVPAPVLIVCHGFDKRGFRGYEIFQKLAEAACANGFVSLVFDFRGCGRSTGLFDYGWGEQDDLETAIDFVVSRPEAESNRVLVVGHSLGGAVALYVAVRDRRIRGVGLWATPHDHAYNVKKFISRSRGRLGYYLFLFISYIDAVVNLSRFFSLHVYGVTLRPRDVRRKLMKIKEVDVTRKLKNVSLLIVNGHDDQIVGLEEAEINFDAAKGPKELVVIESERPVLSKRTEQKIIASHVFLGKEEEAISKTVSWLLTQKQLV